jgi:arylformamidase
MVIIEGLRLAEVPEGQYLMIAAPLKISGVEAAPARVLLTDLL